MENSTHIVFEATEVRVRTGALVYYLSERYDINPEVVKEALKLASGSAGTPAREIIRALAARGNHCLVGRSLVVERLYEWAIERAMFEERIRSAERHLSA